MIEKLRDPKTRMRLAAVLLVVSLVCWPMTHVAILVTKPAGASSWVFHLLLALSWWAITFTALDILVNTEARTQLDGTDSGA